MATSCFRKIVGARPVRAAAYACRHSSSYSNKATATKPLLASGFEFVKCASTSSNANLIKVTSPNPQRPSTWIHPWWLRDHCRCSECYNAVTCQRSADLLAISDHLAITSHLQTGDTIHITWSDGHTSTYSAEWILDNTFEGKYQRKKTLSEQLTWDGQTVHRLPLDPISFGEVMTAVDGDATTAGALAEIYQRVMKYGFVKIDGVPPTEADTRRILERICRIPRTVFGGLWETGTHFDHKDTGYLNGYLEAHTDTTYFREAQGYLAFHCTHFEGTGSASILVDGFHVANQLKQSDPEAYRYLSTVQAESEYIEPGEHFFAWGPHFLHHPITGELEQIRFNMLDRAPLAGVAQQDVATYYKHLQSLVKLVRSKENEFRFQLTPGTVLIIDNWRLLHGRAAYQGKRVLRGCYYTRSDFMSRARHLGLV